MNTDVHPELSDFQKKQICDDFYYITTKHDALPRFIPNQHTSTININNFGFRGPDISFEKPENTYRIFVLGSSTTYGAGSSHDSNTISGFLQQYLDEENLPIKIEVINAGKSSFFSLWETQLIKTKLLGFNPDLFIVYDGWGDIDSSMEFHLGKTYETSLVDDAIENAAEVIPFYKSPEIIRITQARMRQDIAPAVEANSTFQFDGTTVPQKVQFWKERWNEICLLGKEKGFDTIIILQPLAGSGNKQLSKYEKIAYEKTTKHYVPYYHQFADALQELDDSCNDVKDLRFVFDSYEQTLLYDGFHAVDEGNKIIAREMYELVLPIIQTKISMNN